MVAQIECCLGNFVVLQGIRTSVATCKKPYIFVIFQGRGSGPPVPPLDPRMLSMNTRVLNCTLSLTYCHVLPPFV